MVLNEKEVIWIDKNILQYDNNSILTKYLRKLERRIFMDRQLNNYYKEMHISENILEFCNKIEEELKERLMKLIRLQNITN